MDNDTRSQQLVAEQASEWLERLKYPKPGEQEAFVRWLRSSSLNVREMLFATALDRALRAVDRRHAIDVQRMLVRVVPGVVTLPASHFLNRRGRLSGWQESCARVAAVSGTRAWRLAAGVVALTLTALGVLAVEGTGHEQSIVTDAGRWQRTVLEDGSVVHAGPRSRLRIAMTSGQRRVELAQGAALFEVAKDPERPFVVVTERAEVRALGTVFAVSRLPDQVRVTVEEGRVAVRRADLLRLHSASVQLSAGEQVAVSAATTPLRVKQVDVDTELAWTRLFFAQTSVAEAAEAFNQRNRLQIHIADRALASRRIGGTFRAADPESFVQLLLRSPYGRGVHRTDEPGLVRLDSRAPEKSQAPRVE